MDRGGEGRGWLFDHSRFDALPRTLVDRCCDLMDHLSGNYLQVDGELEGRGDTGSIKFSWEKNFLEGGSKSVCRKF